MDNNKKRKSKNHVKFSNRREQAFYANLGKKLSSELKEQHLTQEAFAEMVDISVGMVREHLRGTRRMYLYKFLRMTRTLNINGLRLLAEIMPEFGYAKQRKEYLDLCEKLADCSPATIKKISKMLDDKSGDLFT